MEQAIVVFDIGMTNKKIAVYDRSLALRAIERRCFEPVMIDGLETHDLASMESWFFATLKSLSSRYDIRAIVACTHGATFVLTDARGNPVIPCVFYTHEPGPEFHERFYAMAGDRIALQSSTGTPELSALINPAQGLLFARERFPVPYSLAELALPYPQYWGMRLTGKAGVEGTYIGCHTYLYDWMHDTYSSVAGKLGLEGKLPKPLRNSWETLGTILPEVAEKTGLSESTIVTMGIHDSNAALLPYLVKDGGTDFIVNSTGTWCVLMHPRESYGFAPEELGKVVFFNRSPYNKPVKTAIFLGGKEFEVWTELAEHLNGPKSRAASAFDRENSPYREIIRERDSFILPEIVPGSGQFPGSAARAVEGGRHYFQTDLETTARSTRPAGKAVNSGMLPAFLLDARRTEAVLNISLALQTVVALERTGIEEDMKIFIEGGFRGNREYGALIAAFLPHCQVFFTEMKEASSFGAALTGLAALEGTTPSALSSLFSIAKISVSPMQGLAGIAEYRAAWLGLIDGSEQSGT